MTVERKNKYVELAKEIVLNTIDKDKYFVFLFGSRADGTFQHSSDIDIGIIGANPAEKVINKIKDKVDDSIIPYNVQLVDFSKVDIEFKDKVLSGNIKVWNQNKFLPQS